MTVERLPTHAEWLARQPQPPTLRDADAEPTAAPPPPGLEPLTVANVPQAPEPTVPAPATAPPAGLAAQQPGPEVPVAASSEIPLPSAGSSAAGPELPGDGDEAMAAERDLAGWGWRALAILLDFGIIWTVAGIAAVIAYESGASQDDVASTTGLVLICVWVLYFSVCSAVLAGQTVGKRIAGIRVHRQDGRPYGGGLSLWRDSGARALVAILPIVNLLSIVWPWWDRRGQTFHDKLGSTEVRRVVPGTPARGVLLAVLAAAILGLGYGLVDLADTSDAQLQGYPAGYTQNDKDLFIEGCTDEGGTVSSCECSFRRIAEIAPHDRYLEVDRGDAEIPDAWTDAAASCL